MKSFTSLVASKLVLLMLVALLIPSGQTAAQTREVEKRSRVTWEWSDDGWKRRVEVQGKAEFAEDYSDVISMTEGSVVHIEEDQNVRSLTDHVGRAVYVERMQSLTLGSPGVVALILTAIGIYGVIAYSVAQRTREIGIRIAVGAQRSDVFKMVLVKGLILAAWGSAIGLVACYWLSRFISSQLYGVTPYDPLTLVSVAAILAAVALFASFVPARRATKVNPLVALRYE